MDLLSIVAKLVLSDDEYISSLESAESRAESADVDVDGSATVDVNEFNENIDSAEENSKEFGSTFEQVARKLKTALVAGGIVSAIQTISGAFQDAINNASQYADSVDKGSRRLSMSTEAYQTWQHALSQSGADISDVSRGWLQLTDALTTATSSAEDWSAEESDLKTALDTLKINPADYKSTEDLFDAVINGLAGIGSGAERDSLVTAIFGRGGTQLNALLDSGVAGIKELKQEAKDLGLVMSDEDIANGVAYGDALANMNAAIEGLKQNIVSGLFPLLTDAAKMVTSIVAFFNGRTTEKTLQDTFSGIDEELGNMLSTSESTELEAKSLVDQLFDMQQGAQQSDEAFQTWVGTAQRLIEKCPELADAISLSTASFTKSKEEVYADIEALTARAKAMALQNALSAKMTALTEAEQKAIEGQIDVNMKRAASEAANTKAIERANQLLKQYGITFSVWDDEKGGFVDKDTVENLEDVEAVINKLSVTKGVDRKEIEGLNELSVKAGDADKALTDAEASLVKLKEEIKAAEEDYASYAGAVQQMIDELTGFKQSLDQIPNTTTKTVNVVTNYVDTGNSGGDDGEHAKGLNYVPYDNYRAILHRGETVLNQAQSREYRSGSGSFNSAVMYDAIASAVASAVREIHFDIDGKAVGNAVTDYVSRNMYRKQAGRRFGGV